MNASNGYFVLLIWLLFSAPGCQKKMTLERLEIAIQDKLTTEAGIFAVAFKDLTNDEVILINAKDQYHAASTMKTPVLIEIYKQAEEGIFSLSDSIMIKNKFYSIVDSSTYSLSVEDDSEQGLYQLVGRKKTIAELAYDMIIVSSNLATNLVIELVDAKKVTQTMRQLGANDMEVLRGVEDILAYRQGLSNTTTAYDLMVIYEKLARGEVVSKEASGAMIDILFDQRFNEIIPALLPEEVRVAHKTGVITGLHHDSGIVFLPDNRKFVLVLLSREMHDFEAGTKLMAEVSRMIYDYVVQP